jgi:hypothetical protein
MTGPAYWFGLLAVQSAACMLLVGALLYSALP